VVGKSPGNLSSTSPCPTGRDTASGVPHGVRHPPRAYPSARSVWLVAAQGLPINVVVGAEVLDHGQQMAWGC
jgi:hypothetical protein